MTDWLGLPSSDWALLVAICLAAGLVRGFSGFALSALVMASAVTILSPVELIPILWVLEMSASLLMARGGWRDANRGDALRLVAGNLFGWPIGLWLTTTISITASKLTVLIIVLVLAATQLARVRFQFLASQTGTLIAGFVAGIVSGLAHVGGMVVALYALSRDSDPKMMRGTLVTYLFVASFASLFIQLGFGVMDQNAFLRGLTLVVPTVIGVLLGQRLFTPRLQPYYRPFCLWLLIGIATATLVRQFA